jgi:hypothetical protein
MVVAVVAVAGSLHTLAAERQHPSGDTMAATDTHLHITAVVEVEPARQA